MKKRIKLWFGLFLFLFNAVIFSTESRAAEREYTDLSEGAEYDADGTLYHPEGDGILTADYTLPENTDFGWYNGSLRIASGVTLTIPQGSSLHVSSGTEYQFILEEDACILIEGEPQLNEWDMPMERLYVTWADTQINGTIESENSGLICYNNKLHLNGKIHSVFPAVLVSECQVWVDGGEYLCSEKNPIQDMNGDYPSLIEISSPEEETNVPEETGNLKERIAGIWDYAKSLFQEAKADSISENGNWINGDIVVVILCVATVVIILLYVIFDFIRSPFKKKMKILIELAIAFIVVGGGLYFLWNQAVKEQQQKAQETNAFYSKEAVPQMALNQSSRSELKDMEVYLPGAYLVGEDLEPGIYFFESEVDAVSDEADTFYIYFSNEADFKNKEVGAWARRCYVDLKKGEYIYVRNAHFVKGKEQPAYQAESNGTAFSYPPGEYLVGYDIAPGTYRLETDQGICLRDTTLTGTEANFSEYDRDGFHENGETIALKDGQHFYVKAGSHTKLEYDN